MGDASKSRITWSDSYTKANGAISALATVIPSLPPHLSSSDTPAFELLHDPDVAARISALLRQPSSGAVNDNLCAWLYDTFHSSEPDLQLVVLRFLPTLAALYLSRASASLSHPLAGFESVLLAIYAHETAARNGQALTVSIPDLNHASLYHHHPKSPAATSSELHLGVISPSLEPHGTVRSTRRARIVGVGLELYCSRISQIPVGSKLEFCRYCKLWSGQDVTGGESKKNDDYGKVGRINLPWELLQPILRILGHCLMGTEKNEDLSRAAAAACRCLNARALHDINAKAILATGSLVKLAEAEQIDHTDFDTDSKVITI